VSAHQCALVEDNVANLGPAKSLGMLTILVGQAPHSKSDCTIEHVVDLGNIFGLDA
jgi:beta-phosphoglucomutase-like phosphatase (HAD superfamily)